MNFEDMCFRKKNEKEIQAVCLEIITAINSINLEKINYDIFIAAMQEATEVFKLAAENVKCKMPVKTLFDTYKNFNTIT